MNIRRHIQDLNLQVTILYAAVLAVFTLFIPSAGVRAFLLCLYLFVVMLALAARITSRTTRLSLQAILILLLLLLNVVNVIATIVFSIDWLHLNAFFTVVSYAVPWLACGYFLYRLYAGRIRLRT